MAEVDVRRVERIVRNLVTNAIDHADGSDVTLRLAADGEATALTVRDHGVGLQPGQSAMVFNRFWRADPARARTTGGTGLGLAIALEDARLHGGWLQAWGTPGGGAQFRLTLPRRAGDPLTHSPLPLVPARRPRAVSMSAPRRRAVRAPAPCRRRASCGGLRHPARVGPDPPAGGGPARPAAGRAVLQPAGTGPGRHPGRDRLGLPGRDAGQPADHLGGTLVPLRARPHAVAAQPGHDRLRRVDVDATTTGALVRLADTRRLDARGGWRGGSPGRSENLDLRLVSEQGQWRIDNPVERPRGAHLVLRPQLRAVQPLLLRPDRPRAAARPGVHPARRADGHQPGPRPAHRPRQRVVRDHPLRVAVAHRPRPLGGGDRERCRRGAALARRPAGHPQRAVPGGRPARLDAATGPGDRPGADHRWAARRCRCRAGASTQR